MKQTLNWTNPVNYKVKYPDPLPGTITATATSGYITATAGSGTIKPVADKTQYLLDKLQEESAEVIQAVSKVRRFGAQNHHPDRQTTNIQELVEELEDFLAIVAALEHSQYFDLSYSKAKIQQKTTALISS